MTRLGITTLLREYGHPVVLALQMIADALGTSKRTVHKWLKGINRPSPQSQALLRTWLAEQRQELRAKK